MRLRLDSLEFHTAGCDKTREETIRRLHAHEAELKRLGVEHLYLFGSVVRWEAREDSDVDLFFEHPEGSVGLLQLLDIQEAAARAEHLFSLRAA
jgi:predicted nucleotidyltransferase